MTEGVSLTSSQTDLLNTIVLMSDNINEGVGALFRIENHLKSKPNINANPTISNLISSAGNLNAVIPTGFLLIHRDLEKIVGKTLAEEESGSGDADSISSLIKKVAVGAGVAAVGVGLIAGLFSGFSDGTSNSISSVIEQLNQKYLTVEILGADPEVLAAQKEAFILYLKTYFLQQAAATTISETIAALGEGLGKAIRACYKNLIGEHEETAGDRLNAIVEALIQGIKLEDLAKDEGVDTAVREGFASYIKTYFITQSMAMALDTTLSGIAEAISGAINTFFSNLFGLGNSESTYVFIQGIIDNLIQNHADAKLGEDQEVQDAVKTGIMSYITGYFTAQQSAMERVTKGKSIGDAAAALVTGFLGGILSFGKSKESPEVAKINDIINKLMAEVNTEDALKWDELKDARKAGIISYVEAYFQSMTDAMVRKEAGESWGQAAAEGIKSFLSSVNPFSRKDKSNSFTEKLQKLVTIQDSDMPSEEKMKALREESVLNMARSLLSVNVKSLNQAIEDYSDRRYVTFRMDSEAIITANDQTEATEKVASALNDISSKIDVISEFVRIISNKEDTVIPIPTSTNAPANLDVQIPG